MTTWHSILWRLGLTSGVLVFLASCGIEQSNSMLAPPTQKASATTPLLAIEPSPTASFTTAATPSPTLLPSFTPASRVPTRTQTLTNQPRLARLTVKLEDDGKTITLQVGDRFQLDLGVLYSWQVTVGNTGILNSVPNPGDFDNHALYEAYTQGSTTLTATGTPLCSNAVPRCLMPSRLFTLRVIVNGGPRPDQTVTMADNGKTISLAVGQRISLSLGQDYGWGVTVDNPNIVGRVANDFVLKALQGVFEAKRRGATTLHATGVIICPPGRACIQIAIEFLVQLVVR